MHSRTAILINNTVPNIIVIVYIAHRLLHQYQILTAVFNSYAMGRVVYLTYTPKARGLRVYEANHESLAVHGQALSRSNLIHT